MSIFDDLFQPVQGPTAPPPSKFFAQLFSGGTLPDIGPIDDFANGARTFLSNVPRESGLAAVLDLVQRPNYAVANATRTALQGGNVGDIMGAAGLGFTGQAHTTFGDVLKEQGVPEGPALDLGPLHVSMRDVAGTALDIGLDPTTYLTFGTSAEAKLAGKGLLGETRLLGHAIAPVDPFTVTAKLASMVTDLPGFASAKAKLAPLIADTFQSNAAAKAFVGAGDKAGLTLIDRAQTLRPTIRANQTQLAKDLATMLAPLDSPELSTAFFRAADQGITAVDALKSAGLAGTPEEVGTLQPVLDFYTGTNEPAWRAIKQTMGLDSFEASYMPHVFLDKGNPISVGSQLMKRSPGSFKARTGAAGYTEDPLLALFWDRAEVKAKQVTNTLIDDAMRQWGTKLAKGDPLPDGMREFYPKGNLQFFPADTVPGRIQTEIGKTGSATITADDLKGVMAAMKGERYAVPEPIWKMLNTVTNPKETPAFLRMFDTVQALWKGSVTTPWPGYQVRNAMGDFLNNTVEGITLPDYVEAIKVQKAADPAKMAVTAAGKVVDAAHPDAALPLDQFTTLLAGRNVTTSGYFGLDTANLADSLGKSDSSLVALADKLGAGETTQKALSWVDVVYRMRVAGQAREDNFRIAHVLGKMAQGQPLEDAMMSTKKALFDYGDLSQVEKDVFKRVVPFYAWSRKNIPRQVELITTKPGYPATVAKLAGFMGTSDALTDEQKALMPGYVSERFGVTLDNSDPQHPKILSGLGMPIEDINKLWSQTPLNTLQNLMQDASPLLKSPIELMTNKSFFTGKAIDDPTFQNYYRRVNGLLDGIPGLKQWLDITTETGMDKQGNEVTYYNADPWKNYLLMAVLGRLDSTASKITSETYTPAEKWLSVLTGAKVASPDLLRPQLAFDFAQKKVLDVRNAQLADAADAVVRTAEGSEARDLAMVQYRKQRSDILKTAAIKLDQARTDAASQQGITQAQIDAGELARRGLYNPNESALARYHDFDAEDPKYQGDLKAFFQDRDTWLAAQPKEQQAYIASKSNTWTKDLPPAARSVEEGYQQALGSFRDYLALQPYTVKVDPARLQTMQTLDSVYRAQPTDYERAVFKAKHPELSLYYQLRANPSIQRKLYVQKHPEMRAYGLVGGQF